MTERIFICSSEGDSMPLTISEKDLNDFRSQGLNIMNACIDSLAGRVDPSIDSAMTQLDLVGRLMIDGSETGNTRKVIMCALWLAHTHPDITGVQSVYGRISFMRGAAVAPQVALAA